MTGFQSPQLLTDLYRDLRDRRLLPLVLVLAVGLIVVPVALSSSPGPQVAAPAPAAPVAESSNAPAAQVVVADPGLRDYRRRLEGDTPKDPFVQLFTAPLSSANGAQSSATGSSSASTGAGTTSSETGTTPTGTAGSTAPSGSSPTGTGTSQQETKYITYRLKVRSGQVGGEMKSKDNVGPLTELPNDSVPALSYIGATLGPNLNPRQAVFLVSTSVSSLSGDFSCSFGDPEQCQLVALKPGQYVDLVWTDGLQYRVKLLEFELRASENPPATGSPGTGSGAGSGSSAGRAGSARSASSHRAAPLRFTF